jgi:glycosyltransferase involved in cell wall biosynthesis
MKFLMFTQYFPPEVGAPQVRLAAMARSLVSLGHEVQVVTGMPNYPTGRIFPEYRNRMTLHEVVDGIDVRRTWLFPAMGAGPGRVANFVSFSATGGVALATAKRPGAIFVESPPLTLAVPAAAAAFARGVPWILNVADLWPDTAVALGLLSEGTAASAARRLERWGYARADVVTAVTEGLRDEVLARGVPEGRLAFLPNGVDLGAFGQAMASDEAVKSAGLDPQRPFALYVGTIGYVHGLDTLVDAASELDRRESDVQIAVVGDGSERARLESLARGKGLPNTRFLDALPPDRVGPLLSSSTVAVSCLRDLPMMRYVRPSKLLPAMASAVPIVYSGQGEGAALVEGADAGIVTPPGDAVALADAIEQLASDRERAARLGANGRAYVERHLTWDRLVADWLEQLEERGIS